MAVTLKLLSLILIGIVPNSDLQTITRISLESKDLLVKIRTFAHSHFIPKCVV